MQNKHQVFLNLLTHLKVRKSFGSASQFYILTKLNKYPIRIIPIPTLAKNVASSFVVMTLFKITASGRDNPAIPIINASEVPSGTPFAVIPKITGTIVEHPA